MNPQDGELQADPDLPNKLNQAKYQDAFFWVIANCYNSIKGTEEAEIGGVIHDCEEVMRFTKEMICDEKEDILQCLQEKFIITNNINDAVPVRNIVDHLKRSGKSHSPQKIGLIINKIMKLPENIECVKKSNGVRMRVGITEKDDC